MGTVDTQAQVTKAATSKKRKASQVSPDKQDADQSNRKSSDVDSDLPRHR